jgi:aminocarboxymuconate-semialdehyde decarboxylase
MRLALEFAGEDHLLAGSDYPHQIGSIPLMLESIEKFDVDGRVKQKILGANAARLLGLS